MLLALLLAGCGSDDHDELRAWMQDVSKDMRGKIPPLPAVKPYEAVPYEVEAAVDPFRASKIEPEGKLRHGSGKGGLQPDFEARELRNSMLEKYPLESIKMIGFLNINRKPLAVVQVDQHVKQVRVGEFMGMDFGRVTQISEREVALKELIQDSEGDWIERTTTLAMQSKEQGK
jgi:type IV pilus assembly protein PilP